MKCTWENCTDAAVAIQMDKDGNKWADLCTDHAAELARSLPPTGNAKPMLRAWIKAQGGAKAAAARMTGC